MKKFISTLICIAISFGTVSVFAENTAIEITDNIAPITIEATSANEASETPEPEADVTLPETGQVSVTATIADAPFVKESDATLEIFSLDGKSLDKKTVHIARDTKEVIFTFDVPAFEIGTDFILKAISGLDTIQYYTDIYHTGAEIILPTYFYTDSDGVKQESTDIAVTINPLYDKSINLYYNATSVPAKGARVINGTAMVPAEAVAKFIGFDARYDAEYNSEAISLEGKNMFFNVGTTYTTIFGKDLFTPEPTVMIDGVVYIPLRTFADAIDSDLEVKDYMTHMDINMSESTLIKEYYDRLPINKWGISSRTNYMVWISLSEYKVRLYQGREGHWTPIHEATCGIGAPSTPTVTGSYEYNYKTQWDYGTYYVGPCLVFYRGYALHSVLLRYDGTEYDGRVGMQLSHGCIRLKKNDIDFIANTIPVGTRIYITP